MSIALALLIAFAAFTLSAAAGLGGSLILVPALGILLGPKQGIALAALLLGANNLAKVIVYRATLPLREAFGVLLMTVLGSAVGATLLGAASDRAVSIGVAVSFAAALLVERTGLDPVMRTSSPWLAFGAGATSGFAGTSGPLKGLALRGLGLDRFHFVGAAALVSLAGDLMKAVVFAKAGLFDDKAALVFAGATPLMILGTLLGRRMNRRLSGRAFTGVFWCVMAGYAARLVWRW